VVPNEGSHGPPLRPDPLVTPLPPLSAPHPTVRVVHSFADLLAVPFEGECNAICWERPFTADPSHLLHSLPTPKEVEPIDEDWLSELPSSHPGQGTARTIIEDLRLLRESGHEPELNLIGAYPRDPNDDLPTDVYSFHVDSANIPTDTFLCTYAGRPSEILLRSEALSVPSNPALRAKLLKRHGGKDDASFLSYLEDSHQALHYRPLPQARPLSLGIGHLWRLAVQFPGAPVKACIHRAPPQGPQDKPRLLLIS
jgi:hypothetical protein